MAHCQMGEQMDAAIAVCEPAEASDAVGNQFRIRRSGRCGQSTAPLCQAKAHIPPLARTYFFEAKFRSHIRDSERKSDYASGNLQEVGVNAEEGDENQMTPMRLA